MRPTRRIAIAIALAALAAAAQPARAHEVRGEVVLLDLGERAIDVEVQVPLRQLELARGSALGADPRATIATDQRALRAYAARHVGARAPDGRAFTADAREVSLERVGDHDVAVFRLRLVAPTGGDARSFELYDDLVLHQVVTATAYVFVRTDLAAGVLGDAPRLIDTLHYQRRAIAIARTDGSRWRGFATAARAGVEHIAAGTDHVMFLLALLLPAPLIAMRGRWRPGRSARASLRAAAGIVTAFAIGHSITLAIGACGVAVLPAAVVETVVAASILVAAVHAARPVFPGREAVIAGAFGLVHGLAFATALAGLGVDRASLVIGVLGFNLGVEAMQLAVLAVALPVLAVLARRRWYRPVRLVGAAVAGMAALAWIAARTGVLVTPIPALVERAAASTPWLVVAAVAGAVAIACEVAAARARAPRAAPQLRYDADHAIRTAPEARQA